MKMKTNIFQIGKTYKIKFRSFVKNKENVSVYTATILEETELFVKFTNREGKEISINKNFILEVFPVN